MYRYIGNKTKLTPYILDRIEQLVRKNATVADIMAGTGTVSLELRKAGYSVVASDVMTYSYHHLMVNLCLRKAPDFHGLQSIGVIKKGKKMAYNSVLEYLNKRAFSLESSRREELLKMDVILGSILHRKTQKKLMP